MRLELLVTAAYLALVGVCAVYAAWEALLFLLYLRGRRARPARNARLGSAAARSVPSVTVQIPLYNERFSAARVIRAVAALEYPREALQVQVLDDSTDDTTSIAAREVEHAARQGLDIRLVHRSERTGFKAGALAEGLRSARGDLVAVFDADFVPAPRFLSELLLERSCFEDPRVAFVQARWVCMNRQDSLFARAQALILDRFFLLQNPTRLNHHFVIQFNGSGGVWRRAAIEDAGGWSSDTLTEDLDLSYRAALRGWRGVYVEDVIAPSEVPRDMPAFKRQQRRWARGSTQCTRKLAGRLLGARWSLPHRLAELLTVSGYLFQAMFVFNALLWPFAVLFVEPAWLLTVTQLAAAPAWLVLPIGLAATSHAAAGRLRRELLPELGMAITIGLGSSLSNTVAAARGLLGDESGVFERTPKLGGERSAEDREGYRVPLEWTLAGELLLAVYCFSSAAALAALGRPLWAPGPVLWGLVLMVTVALQVGTLLQPRAVSEVPAASRP